MNIQNILEKNNLIIFAGAGLSKNLNLPDWSTMVIKTIEKSNNPKLIPFINLLKDNTMSALDVLDYLKNDSDELYHYIENNFKIDTDKNLTLQKKLLELSNNKVITTNYDNAFELACNNKVLIAKPTSKYTINEIQKNKNEFIFKLHGSYDEPDSCIIFKEDYNKLYSIENNEAAPEKLKTLFTNSTFLFIGFGFNDPDIDFIFDKMNQTFGGLNRHFIITPESDKFKKYSFLEPIEIDNYSQLESKIDDLIKIKSNSCTIDSNTKIAPILSLNKTEKRKKIAILYPEILGQNTSSDYKNTISLFEETETDLMIGSLNLKTLNLIDDSDLLVIISNTYKGKIYLEENNLKSNLLDLEEILDNLPNANTNILLLTNEEIDISNIPYAVINIFKYKNQTIKRFLHKVINDKSFNFNEDTIKSNSNSLSLELEKGKAIKKNLYGNNRNLEIGKKCLTNVVGRMEELSNLIARILIIINSNKILNIKASGGLGKTTLVKKAAYELYNRGYFKNGVNFKSCENVKNYDDFEELVIEGFNLADILNFKDYLIENYSNEKIDLLVILDNFETVANNLSGDDHSKAINLLEFISDYSNIVITSREIITNKEFEEVFTLTPMTTDDALELFKLNYRGKKNYTNDEIKTLRAEILEDLLANNPLAIKLVTTSRPEMKITHLRDQIKNHFFESINEEYSVVFENNADLNIEKTRSIYQSINYSYSFLNVRQKLAFELLSLFPDGINLTDFKKCFKNGKSSNNITDNEIKQLENKSLLENYNGVLQLQPIIRRFAEYQFNNHGENMQKYCIDAYSYNVYTINYIDSHEESKSISYALVLFSSVKNNLLKVLEYIPLIKIEEAKKKFILNYLFGIHNYLTNNKNISYFNNKINSLISYFNFSEDAEKLIKVMILRGDYYHNEFDNSYNELCKLLSVEQMLNRDISSENYLEKRWKNLISIIHSMEGYTIQYLQSCIDNFESYPISFSEYHYLGISNMNITKKGDPFYYFENQLRNNEINVIELKKHIQNLFMEEHLQIMQCTYTLSKLEEIPLNKIKKMVISNPYTKGLKNLMLAFNTYNQQEKEKYFENALENLQHIKYYYIEAMYFYAQFLKIIESEKYDHFIILGLTLSQKYKYQYLDHLFNNLFHDKDDIYFFSYEYYEIDALEDFCDKENKRFEKIWKDSK
ncbi:MAG: SIR2 family protein [Chryseobacterium culicis]